MPARTVFRRSALLLCAGALALPGLARGQADEIVVQARKRAESLQNIPVSGSVLGEQDLQDIGGITDAVQLADYVTALQVDEEGNAEYFIRGAGSGRNPLADSATSQLLNGANTAGGFGGRAFQSIDNFDARQIEVYRGAQGALYGRSAVGGVVNVVSQEPKDRFEYGGLLSYDFEREQYRIEGIVNQPLIENRLFARLGVQVFNEEGLYTNSVPFLGIGEEPGRPIERYGVRGGLRWLIDTRTDATMFVTFEDFAFDNLLNARAASVQGEPIATGAGVRPDGTPFPGPQTPFPPPEGDVFDQHMDTPGWFDQELFNVFLQVNRDLDFATLASITNWRYRTYDFLLDVDTGYVGGPPNVMGGNDCRRTDLSPAFGPGLAGSLQPFTTMQCESKTSSDSSILTQEFRLVSSAPGPFQWLAGVDYRWFQNPIISEQFGFSQTPLVGPQAPIIANPRLDIDQENHEFGLFGSLGYEFIPTLTVSASARYSYIDKAYTQTVTSNDPDKPDLTAPGFDRGLVFQNVSPSLALTWEPANQILAYASWAQAFRAGGFNRTTGTSTAAGGSEIIRATFDEELANSYELGVKGTLPMREGTFRYAVAAFYVFYNGVLQNATATQSSLADDPDADAAFFQPNNLANVGDAYVRGVEAELGGTLRDVLGSGGRLNWSGGIAFSESRITDLSTGIRPDRIDDHLAELPQWTWNGNFTYRRPMPFFETAGLGLFANTNFAYETGRHQQGQEKRGNLKRWNARLGVEGERYGARWQLVAFFDNVFDVQYQRANVTCNQGPAFGQTPCFYANDRATWGLRLSFRGD
ncbi:MAG: TonB-dependent receptor [Alphaproteobacteria bacterium]|nr:TonB-dependent receptor [Alphaproteobacteria bacterium]